MEEEIYEAERYLAYAKTAPEATLEDLADAELMLQAALSAWERQRAA